MLAALAQDLPARFDKALKGLEAGLATLRPLADVGLFFAFRF